MSTDWPSIAGPAEEFDVAVLTSTPRTAPPLLIEVADAAAERQALALRHQVFVLEQGLFADTDRDDHDLDPRRLVLVARDADGTVVGAVRLAPVLSGTDLGWWAGSRLAVRADHRRTRPGIGPALVRSACAHAERLGALRFDASVQAPNVGLFSRLGWTPLGPAEPQHGRDHVPMTWPVGRVDSLVQRTKAALGPLLSAFGDGIPGSLGGPGFIGDDAAPVPGSDLVAATDAILPSMVERDPEWAGWCAVLVNVNDLAAMGAAPVALLDAVAARDASFATRVLRGLRRGAAAWGVPLVGGHTQLGAPAALAVTALGRTADPVRGGGGRPGDVVRLTADLGGGWRPGATGTQWDSTTSRTPDELSRLQSWVARSRPAAAKDVSMAGVVGTLGMLAEASGCGAVLDVADVPTPPAAGTADWLTCFPGFAMVTAHRPGATRSGHRIADPDPAVSAVCGELVAGHGVALRWPDGRITTAVAGAVTGLANP